MTRHRFILRTGIIILTPILFILRVINKATYKMGKSLKKTLKEAHLILQEGAWYNND